MNPYASAAERSDERVCIDASLTKESTEGASLELTMKGHHATGGTSSKHHVAAALTNHNEPKQFKRCDGLRPPKQPEVQATSAM